MAECRKRGSCGLGSHPCPLLRALRRLSMGRVLIPLRLLNRLRKFPSKSCSISGLFEAKGAKSYGCILHVTFLCRAVLFGNSTFAPQLSWNSTDLDQAYFRSLLLSQSLPFYSLDRRKRCRKNRGKDLDRARHRSVAGAHLGAGI